VRFQLHEDCCKKKYTTRGRRIIIAAAIRLLVLFRLQSGSATDSTGPYMAELVQPKQKKNYPPNFLCKFLFTRRAYIRILSIAVLCRKNHIPYHMILLHASHQALFWRRCRGEVEDFCDGCFSHTYPLLCYLFCFTLLYFYLHCFILKTHTKLVYFIVAFIYLLLVHHVVS
jgi:hypothetical protein